MGILMKRIRLNRGKRSPRLRNDQEWGMVEGIYRKTEGGKARAAMNEVIGSGKDREDLITDIWYENLFQMVKNLNKFMGHGEVEKGERLRMLIMKEIREYKKVKKVEAGDQDRMKFLMEAIALAQSSVKGDDFPKVMQ